MPPLFGLCSVLTMFSDGVGFHTIVEVLLHELLDLGRIRASFEPGDRTLALDEHERRHLPHLEPLGELRLLLDIHVCGRSAGAAPCGPAGRAGSPSGGRGRSGALRRTRGGSDVAAGPPGSAVHHLLSFPGLAGRRNALQLHWLRWPDWYTVGLFAGLGVAVGIAVVGVLGGRRIARLALVLARRARRRARLRPGRPRGGCGRWHGRLARSVRIGAARRWSACPRGNPGWRPAFLVLLGAAVVALLAFVPGLGYLEAIAVPVLGMRLRRRAGKRYAGLRTLARD